MGAEASIEDSSEAGDVVVGWDEEDFSPKIMTVVIIAANQDTGRLNVLTGLASRG